MLNSGHSSTNSYLFSCSREHMYLQSVQQTSVISLHILVSERNALVISIKCGGYPWNSFTNHNTRNYLHCGNNITANQRLSPIFCGNQNTINNVATKTTLFPTFFFLGEGVAVHTQATFTPREMFPIGIKLPFHPETKDITAYFIK